MLRTLGIAVALAGAVLTCPSAAQAATNGLIAFTVVQPVETCDQCGPDGNSEHVGGGSRIWLVRPDGTSRRRLPCTGARGACSDSDPAFSRDGTRLAIRGARGLVVMTPGGRELLRVDPFPGWSPSWGPGGRRLAYVTAQTQPGDSEGRGIALTDLAGHDRMIIQADASSVAWSPRGPLAWTVFRGYFRGYRRSTLWVGDAEGRGKRVIARRAETPSWAPDGSRIAFLGPGGLAVLDADGGRRRLLTRACGIDYDGERGVAWSPDGTAIACSGRGGSLVVLDLRSMTVRKVVPQRLLGQGAVDGISWQPAPARPRRWRYGAFIVHPPVLVGLAFAVQPLPVPAELKFIAVLIAGVAGSFGLTALARRRILDHRGQTLADADAHRGHSVAGAAAA